MTASELPAVVLGAKTLPLPVIEAAAKAWGLISRQGWESVLTRDGQPGLPLGFALDMVQEVGCDREVAFVALRDAARELLASRKLPGGIFHNPDQWAVSARIAIHMIGAPSHAAEFVGYHFQVATQELDRLTELLMRPHNLIHQKQQDRDAWLAWADDARLAILWLRELATLLGG